MEPMEKNVEKRSLKPYHGLIAIIVTGFIIFVMAPLLSRYLGVSVNILSQLMLLAVAVIIPVAARVDLRKVFPLEVPTLEGTVGTLLLYSATQAGTMVIALVLNRLFPQSIHEVNQGMSQLIFSLPALVVMVMVIILPAICEEAVFRGVFLQGLSGRMKNKWMIMIVTGVIFGAFHGNVLRAIPTALIGMILAYLVLETGNIFYSMMFHFLNNLIAIVPVLLLQYLYDFMGSGSVMQSYEQAGVMQIPLLTIGFYVLYASVIPFGFYAGNYLLHIGKPGYEAPLFSKEHKKTYIILGSITVGIIVFGFCLIMFSFITEQGLLRNMIQITR